MRPTIRRVCLACSLMGGMATQTGCSDVGDDASSSNAAPVDDSGAAAMALSDSSSNAGTLDATVTGAAPDGAAASNPGLDAGIAISTHDAAPVADAGVRDAVAPDATFDAGWPDANAGDSAAVDSTANADAAGNDATPAFPGTLADGGSFDSLCQAFNADAGCTPTESLFLEHDPTGACYLCLVNNGGLDDALYPDTGHECSDVTGNAVAGAQAGVSREALCLSTLSCILGASGMPTCATDGQPTFCYCGATVGPAACSALTAAPAGQCTSQEADGLELPTAPTIPVLKAYPNESLGSGMANAIFNQAAANGCTSCF